MSRIGIAIVLGAVSVVPACQPAADKGGSVTGADVKRDVKKALDTTERFINEQTEGFGRRVNERLREIDIDLDAWKRKLDDATAEERPELERTIRSLEKQRAAVGREFDALKEAGRDTWQSGSERLDRTLTDLKNAARHEPR